LGVRNERLIFKDLLQTSESLEEFPGFMEEKAEPIDDIYVSDLSIHNRLR
jgi:hypothetical protein